MVSFVGIPNAPGGIRRYALSLINYMTTQRVNSKEILHAVQPISTWMFTYESFAYNKITNPFVVTCHDLAALRTDTEEARSKSRVWKRIFRKRAEESFKKAEVIIANSSLTANDIEERFGYEEKIKIIPMGIDPGFKPHFKNTHRKIRVGCCTRSLWRAEKVMRILSESASLLPLRWYDFSEVPDYYNSLDVFLHCSTNEGFGYPILEAQACKIPVIVFKDARIPEEVTRYATKAEDEQDAANKIKSFQYIDTEIPMWYAQSFTIDRMGEQTLGIYEKLNP